MQKPFMSIEAASKYTSNMLPTLQHELKVALQTAKVPARIIAKYDNMPEITVKWHPFGFHMAGRATFDKQLIEMNTNYLYSKDYKLFIDSTFRHELAHLIAGYLGEDFGHGKTWKMIDMLLGDKADRCHDYSEPINKPVNHNHVKFKCACGTMHEVTKRKAEGMKAGRYICTVCKRNLKNAKIVA